ncbi:hypothetical protein ABVK25_010303 [Lepraria finkii]|uniref:Uncharacterized protein n=1 Tax=Lepraria finkii TaxID=1340010 RepID=A0ABR4AXK8_9LECA
MPSTLYILYNADASLMGKLNYGYRKCTAPKDKPACSACDITHGGLHLDETAAWKEAKAEIASKGDVEVKQKHRDELSSDVRSFVEKNKLNYPMVLSGDEKGDLRVTMDSQELASCGGNAQQFVAKLREKGAL